MIVQHSNKLIKNYHHSKIFRILSIKWMKIINKPILSIKLISSHLYFLFWCLFVCFVSFVSMIQRKKKKKKWTINNLLLLLRLVPIATQFNSLFLTNYHNFNQILNNITILEEILINHWIIIIIIIKTNIVQGIRIITNIEILTKTKTKTKIIIRIETNIRFFPFFLYFSLLFVFI